MKILTKGAFFLAFIGMINVSCEKDKEAYPASNLETNYTGVEANNFDFYSHVSCLVQLPEGQIGPLYKSQKCVVSNIDGCASITECTYDSQADFSEFTQEELDGWQAGEDVFEYTSDFINDHYNYFLYLHESGLGGHHPDTIIARNGL